MAVRPRPRTGGYTLLEVLIATAIMGTLLAIGVPRMLTLRGPYALTGAANRIAADLQVARQRAIARNVRYRVFFSSAGSGYYQVEREASPNTFVKDSAKFVLPHEVHIGSATPSNPIFNSRGMLTANVSLPVSVTGVGTKTVTTNVLGQTTIQ